MSADATARLIALAARSGLEIARAPATDWTRAWIDRHYALIEAGRGVACCAHLEVPDPDVLHGVLVRPGTASCSCRPCLGWLFDFDDWSGCDRCSGDELPTAIAIVGIGQYLVWVRLCQSCRWATLDLNSSV